ncbi:zinc-dependent alcohol dehydrogenase family protein [Nitrospirillum viridazoti]|uniref:NAD(P)-dependent alcohol dehydrogenase n=1 Tax=Nitrospirillum viridazoti CBAmc TaxID=1441467 RepID=A0A248JND0_9PROT|nr:NAD(P)-dependent alcohol dehydrogenase [Nitrospirillum amazonense]ASG20217.1 NAD(P)-dependent alcohol dehydrogenase [Nitrospirillum amazonense CBAmc]TWB29505.1 NADPH:quinone reductase-like Zn-dependent oxidoreductase [Nitrospirillum amazonense]
MQSFHLGRQGDIDRLEREVHADPTPGKGEVLVRVRASSLNYRDIMILEGRYGRVPFIPGLIPLSDAAGEVVAVGEAVTRFRSGDRVALTALPGWLAGKITPEVLINQPGANRPGVLSDIKIVQEDALVALPESLSFEEAATLPGAAVTAWVAVGHVRPGETVLVQGTGGVSLFALLFAKNAGARVIATTSSDEKAERLKVLGVDTVVNYQREPEWHLAVREATGGRGADHVIEIGGTGTLERSIQAAAMAGHIELVGTLAGGGSLDAAAFARNIVTIRWASVGSRADFEAMNRAIAVHRLQPVIDRVFPFAEARQAYRHFQSRSHFGKVVIRHDD